MNRPLPACLRAARHALADVTPLSVDCGRLCRSRCCRPLEGEDTGMLLFPGEEACYAGLRGYIMKETAAGTLLVCSGQCLREDRPLSCRLFPLLPLLRPEGIKVAMDARATPVCPLARQGIIALRQDFVEAVRACGTMLMESEEQRRFLLRLTAMQDDLRILRRQFGGNVHV